jgi:hypothetical protein
MENMKYTYCGYDLYPFSVHERDSYAAMLIVEGYDGTQRGTGVIDYFLNADLACQASINYGIELIDQLIIGLHSTKPA